MPKKGTKLRDLIALRNPSIRNMVKLGELEVELDFPYPDLTSIFTSALDLTSTSEVKNFKLSTNSISKLGAWNFT